MLDASLDGREIHRVLDDHGVDGVSVEIDGGVERLGDGQVHDGLQSTRQPVAFDVAPAWRPFILVRLVQQSGRLGRQNMYAASVMFRSP